MQLLFKSDASSLTCCRWCQRRVQVFSCCVMADPSPNPPDPSYLFLSLFPPLLSSLLFSLLFSSLFSSLLSSFLFPLSSVLFPLSSLLSPLSSLFSLLSSLLLSFCRFSLCLFPPRLSPKRSNTRKSCWTRSTQSLGRASHSPYLRMPQICLTHLHHHRPDEVTA